LVKIALAPDWSPSGSDGMIEELKYAATGNASQVSPVFDNAELAKMATAIPAHDWNSAKALSARQFHHGV
jgi:hypothetical protein